MQLHRPTRIAIATVAAICAVAIGCYLWKYDPTQFPAAQCTFHRLTGLDCPGCGAQRAIHALLHGNFTAAWHFNPALFIAVPVAFLYIWNPKPLRPILHAAPTPWILIAAIIAFWIFRNSL